MAVNSDSTKKKIKKSAKSCPSAILKAVPTNYEKISFAEFNSAENYEGKAIIGKICHLNPIGVRPNGHIRKLLVTDGLEEQKEDQKKLTIFLLNQFAQDSEAAEIEGYIIIANFSLEKSTHYKEQELPFQILVKNPQTQVWFGKKVPPSQSKLQNKNKTKQKIKIEQAAEEPVILSHHYQYVHLQELRETQDKETFNIYGVVEKCDLKVTQTKRSQVLDLVLTDNTETDFSCSVYCTKDETFPNIYPGDIIRIHRIKVEKFRSKLKGKCLSSKFILVFSKGSDHLKPRTVAKSFTFTPEDSKRVKELFDWYEKKNQPKLISEIERGDFVNIVCQVIGVYISKNQNAVVLKIWDGTKSNKIEGTHLGLGEEKLDEKLFNIAKSYYINLFVYGSHCAIAAELKPLQYIEVCDANLYSPRDNPDDCKLRLSEGNKEKRGIRVLNMDDDPVKELKERLESIVADAQEFANQTDDILSGDNTIFLNCDISALPSSQTTFVKELDNANIDALNNPLSSVERIDQEQNVISVVTAAVKPGQSTQEFGEEMQKEYMEVDLERENELSPAETDPVLNKTPLELRMFLHNPNSQIIGSSVPPFTSDTPEEWWNSLQTISTTEDHNDLKPASLVEVIHHEVPYKFRVLCSVLSYKPNITSILQLIHLYCPSCMFMSETSEPSLEPSIEQEGLFQYYCPECSKEVSDDLTKCPLLKYTYVILFELHDGTTQAGLETYVWNENAIKFFKGITPEQALRDKEMTNLVLQMLWSVCPNNRPSGIGNSLNNNKYPILDCCVMSYTVSNQTVYQMFDTRLI